MLDVGRFFSSALRRGVFSPDFRTVPVYQKLALLAVLLLPFQSALTIPVGFPLKASELLLTASAVTWLFYRGKFRVAKGLDLAFVGMTGAFVLCSFLVGIIVADLAMNVRGLDRSPIIDMTLYAAYGLFVVGYWFLLRGVSSRLLLDVLVQSVWLCLVAVIAQAVLLQIGASSVLQTLGFWWWKRGQEVFGFQFGRSGPFLEGQHLGFYAGVLFVVALFAKRWWSLGAACFCLLYSQSTTGLGGAAVAVIAALLLIPRKRLLLMLGGAAVVGAGIVALVPQLRSMFYFQLAKLGWADIGEGVDATRSLDIREMKSTAGWRMMQDHPLVGVGPGRYAAHFDEYTGDFRVPDYYYTEKVRAIAENGYAQIGAEFGVVALAAFVALLLWLLFRCWSSRDMLGTGLVVFVAIGFATQSSWTFMPIWVALALAASRATRRASMMGSIGHLPARSRRELRRDY